MKVLKKAEVLEVTDVHDACILSAILKKQKQKQKNSGTKSRTSVPNVT